MQNIWMGFGLYAVGAPFFLGGMVLGQIFNLDGVETTALLIFCLIVMPTLQWLTTSTKARAVRLASEPALLIVQAALILVTAFVLYLMGGRHLAVTFSPILAPYVPFIKFFAMAILSVPIVSGIFILADRGGFFAAMYDAMVKDEARAAARGQVEVEPVQLVLQESDFDPARFR